MREAHTNGRKLASPQDQFNPNCGGFTGDETSPSGKTLNDPRRLHTSGIYDDLPPYVRAWQGEPGKPGGKVVRKAPTAADLLQIGRKAIYKLIHDGDLVGYKLNERVVLVEVASIQRYIDARRIVAPGKGA